MKKEEIEKQIKERTGMENYNHQGLHMVIKTYYGVRKVDVVFDDGYMKTTDYKSFLQGSVLNPNYSKRKYGAITGIKYSPNLYKKEYRAWGNILTRCFSKNYKEVHPTYINVTVCDKWMYFDNFCEWIMKQENYEQLKGIDWAPDKDILIKGNKLYSPETVCLVPQNVNKLFLRHDNARGKLPIGVTENKYGYHKRYVARCNNPLGKNWFEYFYTADDAFAAYKRKKEEIIKLVAEDEYSKGNISTKCYNAMMKYQVEITD